VRARVHAGDYLRARRAEYLARLPNSLDPLPKVFTVLDGQMVVRDNTADGEDVYPDAPTFQAAAERRGHPTYQTYVAEDRNRRLALIAQQRAAATAELPELSTRLAEATARREQLKREQDAEIANGASLAPATTQRAPALRGRPTLPFPWGRAAYFLGTTGCLVAEAYQFALPYFDVTGIDSTNLAAEWVRNPLGIITGAAFALGASGALFLFADQVVENGLNLFKGEFRGVRAAVTGLWVCILLALIGGAACGIGAMRGDLSNNATGSASVGRGTLFMLLTTMLPFGVAFLHQKIHAARGRRDEVRTAQRNWDAEQEQMRRTGERREERLRQAFVDERATEQRQRELRDLIDRLDKEADEIQRQASTELMTEELALREQLAADRHYLLTFLNAVEAAIEKDRYQFVKRARKRHPELLDSTLTDAAPKLGPDGHDTAGSRHQSGLGPVATDGGAEHSNGNGRRPTLLQLPAAGSSKIDRWEGALS